MLHVSSLHRKTPSATALCLTALFSYGTPAQDVQRGAMLYMRLPNDVTSCVSCHGPDPGQNHNNILRAADNPATLVKVINTTSRMGYLSAELSEADTRDITGFLGSVVRSQSEGTLVRLWPVTMDFGNIAPGLNSGSQVVRIANPSISDPLRIDSIVVNSPHTSFQHNCPTTLGGGASCDVTLVMRPGNAGLHRAALQISAAGQTSVAGMVGYGASEPVSALTWTSPESVTMTVQQGSVGQTSLTLDNPGPMPAVLALTSITGPQASQFRVESGCAVGTVVQSGTSCSLVVSYTADRRTESSAVLQLRSNQTNPPAVILRGTSTPLPGSDPVVTQPSPGGSASGCASTSNVSHSRDVSLWAALIAAALLAFSRRKRALQPQ
jgi:cytochrome c553